MNSAVRKYYEDRLEKIIDRKEEYQSALADIDEEIETIEQTLGEEDIKDLNRQYERSV